MFLRPRSAIAPLASVLALTGVLAALGACSDDSTEAGPTGSSSGGSSGNGASSGASAEPEIDGEECKTRCGGKLETCGAPAATASAGCAQLCAPGITESQATCLENKDCDELEKLAGGSSIDSVCPKATGGSSSGTSGSSSGSTSGSTSSGGSNNTPENLTITATIPSDYEAIHTKSGNKIASLFNVAPKPSFDPNVPINATNLPLLDEAGSVTLDSPDRPSGACGTAKFGFVLNSSQIGVQISGTDELPETGCATFTDELVKGATFTLKDVPWNNSSVKATVKIILK